jgi:two-component system, cell cycle sensor histidine kinase and response regulator CckA
MDDEPAIRRVSAMILERLGYAVVAVSEGSEAVRAFRTAASEGKPFDVVVLDLTIPGGMGGMEALAELRRIDPAVRAIVCSGYSNDAALADYRAHGFMERVAKPYETEDLARAIESVLGQRDGVRA